LKKEEFMKEIEGCKISVHFDQALLDRAAEMFNNWGLTGHMSEEEYLFKKYGLVSKDKDDSEQKKQKEALRCVASKIMKMQLSKEDAANIMKNFNKIRDPDYKATWGE